MATASADDKAVPESGDVGQTSEPQDQQLMAQQLRDMLKMIGTQAGEIKSMRDKMELKEAETKRKHDAEIAELKKILEEAEKKKDVDDDNDKHDKLKPLDVKDIKKPSE